jgi:hypothetical protein
MTVLLLKRIRIKQVVKQLTKGSDGCNFSVCYMSLYFQILKTTAYETSFTLFNHAVFVTTCSVAEK